MIKRKSVLIKTHDLRLKFYSGATVVDFRGMSRAQHVSSRIKYTKIRPTGSLRRNLSGEDYELDGDQERESAHYERPHAFGRIWGRLTSESFFNVRGTSGLYK